MPPPRARSARAKVTDDEYGQLEPVAQARGITVGEGRREVLLNQLNLPDPTTSDVILLVEVWD